MRKQKRDIYKTRTAPNFDIYSDIDLADLRDLMSTEILTSAEYDRYGLYCLNLLKILCKNHKFIGYSDSVKEDLCGAALPDILVARRTFKGSDYPQPTAPFNYLYRISYNAFARTLKNYYEHRENNIVPMSCLPDGTDEMVEKEIGLNWCSIEENIIPANT